MSALDPSREQLERAVLWAQERAERLAARIVLARHALRGGQGAVHALAILDGAEETATPRTERPEAAGPTPEADGLLDFGDWDGDEA